MHITCEYRKKKNFNWPTKDWNALINTISEQKSCERTLGDLLQHLLKGCSFNGGTNFEVKRFQEEFLRKQKNYVKKFEFLLQVSNAINSMNYSTFFVCQSIFSKPSDMTTQNNA